jgi:hypothetical protein
MIEEVTVAEIYLGEGATARDAEQIVAELEGAYHFEYELQQGIVKVLKHK